MESQCSGGWAEQQALQQLEAQGWRLLDRNWHCRWGELDLVLERQQQLLRVKLALVPLMMSCRTIRWIDVERLC